MNKLIPLFLSALLLNAQTITLSPEQESNWQIKTAEAQVHDFIPLGNLVGSVVAPTRLIHSLSVPFDVQIQQIHVNEFDHIKKGETIAHVGGGAWLEVQQDVIDASIKADELKLQNDRKQLLCQEGVIAQKECITSSAAFNTALSSFISAKSRLSLFGATDEQLKSIAEDKNILPHFEIKSTKSGIIASLNVTAGKSLGANEPILTLIEDGERWLVFDLPQTQLQWLHNGQKVQIKHGASDFFAVVASKSPLIDEKTQTAPIRLSLPQSHPLPIGLKTTMKLNVPQSSLSIPKSALVMHKEGMMLFMKTSKGYEVQPVEVLAEDHLTYSIKLIEALKYNSIVVQGIAALKGMLGEGDE